MRYWLPFFDGKIHWSVIKNINICIIFHILMYKIQYCWVASAYLGLILNLFKSLKSMHSGVYSWPVYHSHFRDGSNIERERERERPINIKRRQFISEQKLCWTRFCEHTSDHGDLALGDRESLSRECWDGGLWGVGRHGVDDLSWEATERCGGDDTSIRHGRGRCDLQQHVKYSLFFCKVTTYLHVFHICVHKFFHFASKTDSFRLVFLGF